MITIAQFADIIGAHICEKADLKSRVKEVCYGVECILIILLSFCFFMVIGWLAGVFRETLMITIGMLIMKYMVGGPHLSKLSRCMGFSAIFVIGLSMLFKSGYLYFPRWLLIGILLISFTVIFRYAPLLSPGKEFDDAQKGWRRVFAALMLLIIITLQIITPAFWINGFLIGNLFAIFNITPLGVTLVKRVEDFTT